MWYPPGTGVDVVADLDRCSEVPLPFEENSVTEILGSHVLEHIHQPLPLMQELHRVAVPEARAEFRLPYGSSDDAYEDPTHVRQYFLHSFGYFSQPFYWRADYGYRGDWQPKAVTLMVSRQRYQNRPSHEIMDDVMRLRNVVVEMTVVLRALKPIRLPRRELQVPPRIELAFGRWLNSVHWTYFPVAPTRFFLLRNPKTLKSERRIGQRNRVRAVLGRGE